jgi:folate-dependent phosphoribosylglycinamide formyltransferase PurN
MSCGEKSSMAERFRIGLFTSAWDEVAWKLIKEVYQNIQNGTIPDSEIAFVFCSREEGETYYGDLLIQNVRQSRLPLITFSSLRFKPGLRIKGREAEKKGDLSIINTWRLEHDREVAKLLFPTDLNVLLGYMWVVGEEMCHERTMINLHPALPGGPKGTYREVIWQLIKDEASETGVMIHLVIGMLDMGPPIAYCSFPIKGGLFEALWLELEMESRLKSRSIEELSLKEGENNSLFRLIREQGVIRELPLIVQTIRLLAERKIKIDNGMVIDSQGQVLKSGYDLTKEIDAIITSKVKR